MMVQTVHVQLHLMPETMYLSLDRISIVDAPPYIHISKIQNQCVLHYILFIYHAKSENILKREIVS